MNSLSGRVAAGAKIVALGDSALLVRFASELDDLANKRAVAFAAALEADRPVEALEIVPSLVSVLVRFDPMTTDPVRLAGELALRLTAPGLQALPQEHVIEVRFGGVDGPDLDGVASALGMGADAFIARHNRAPLRVLATGFAPGFVYCGFHPQDLTLPRRGQVRAMVLAGSVLFAAGQTAIAATDIPTGWHLIGRTDFRNFDAGRTPPTLLKAGDLVRFESVW